MKAWTSWRNGLVAVAVAATGVISSPAWANHGYGAQGICSYAYGSSSANPDISCVRFANNRTHTVQYATLGNQYPGIDGALTLAMQDIIRGIPDINAYRQDSASVPDVIAMDNFYGNIGVVGWVDCPAANTGRGPYYPLDGYPGGEFCRGQYLRFNGNNTAASAGVTDKAIACHEMGHTFALRHYTNSTEEDQNFSCMRFRTRPVPETYSPGDRTRVNGAY